MAGDLINGKIPMNPKLILCGICMIQDGELDAGGE